MGWAPFLYPSHARPALEQSTVETSHFDDFDRDAQEQSEARIVNVSDETVRLEIAQQPGSKPRRYTLTPWGSREASVRIQAGYTKPFSGAGRGMVTPTIETLTEREMLAEVPATMGPNGIVLDPGRRAVRLPLVVHEDKAEDARAKYVSAMRRRGESVRDDRAPGTLSVRTAPPTAGMPTKVATGPREDIEDQGGALDEPPPDDDTPPMPVIAAIKTDGPKGKAK